jgi:hypothetical protein
LPHFLQHLLGGNPAIHDPDPLGPSVRLGDLLQDVEQCGFVQCVAGHDFMGQGEALRGHDQGDHHLHAVEALVPAVAELSLIFLGEWRMRATHLLSLANCSIWAESFRLRSD